MKKRQLCPGLIAIIKLLSDTISSATSWVTGELHRFRPCNRRNSVQVSDDFYIENNVFSVTRNHLIQRNLSVDRSLISPGEN